MIVDGEVHKARRETGEVIEVSDITIKTAKGDA